MNAALGHAGILLGFLSALVGIAVLLSGLVRGRPGALHHGRLYAGLILLGAVVATVAMQHALVTHDFSLSYVADNNSRQTPLLFTVTGMWSALEGSILLWTLVLAGYIAAVVHHFRRRADDPLVGWATLTTYAVAAFFFALQLGPADPFRSVIGAVPHDGVGPNPLLQDHPLVAFHPPLLYLGFVGFTVPFAFAVASLVTGRLGEGWLLETRRWTVLAWGFLTAGIVLGAWWSYQVLGWGGFWAWDPVENAAFLPWLCGTAYLHSVMVQERRGLLRVWNLSLLMATFSLTILGTFLTRSGVVQSVHSFSASTIGPVLLGFFGLVVATSVGLIAWRGDKLRSPGSIDSAMSREAAFLANNALFAGFAVVVLLGTVFPLVIQALNGQQVSVGAPFFNDMARPIGLCLLFLMTVAPALPWRKASSELLRARLVWPAWFATAIVVVCVLAGIRGLATLLAFGLGGFAGASALRQLAISTRASRRHGSGAWRGLVGRSNGGMVVHLGVVVIAVALVSSFSYGHRAEFALRPGQTARFDGHTITYVGSQTVVQPNRTALVADVRLDGHGPYHPAISSYGTGSEGVGTPSISSGLAGDVYLTLDNSPTDQGRVAAIGVVVQPLVLWLWVGGLLMLLGTALAAFPGRRRQPTGPFPESPVLVTSAAEQPAPEPDSATGQPAPEPDATPEPDASPEPDATPEPDASPELVP